MHTGIKAVITILVLVVVTTAAQADQVELCRNGKATLDIVVSPQADENVRRVAGQLADYLHRISGAEFQIERGRGNKGLVIGIADHFEDLPLASSFSKGAFKQDDYRILSKNGSLYLLGNSTLAVEFAVWDLLHEFGYRYYFPSERWEIIPSQETLNIAIDRKESPDFHERSAPRGGLRMGLQPWLEDAWQAWQIRNRTASNFTLNTGHAYNGIIERNRKQFAKHPEFLALVDGERGGQKFCISNKHLRELVVRDAVAQIEENPQRDSVSLDPSDGGGWCTCHQCEELGSISDRVIILANAAAEAINELELGEKYVGT